MYMLNARKQRVHLSPLGTEVRTDSVTRALVVRPTRTRETDTFNAAGLIARASKTFFEIGRTAGKAMLAPEPPSGPPPAAFRENDTGFLHIAYHEIVVRFRHAAPARTRDAVLRKYGFKVRETNPFIPTQFVVYDPAHKHSGAGLIDVANDWAEMDEVEFSAPNFVSQFQRMAPAIRAEEWHLRTPGSGASGGEGVDIRAAWQRSTGSRSIVVAVLDDGVDLGHPNLRTQIWKNPDTSSRDRNGKDFFVAATDPGHFDPRPKLFRDPFNEMPGNDIHGTACAGVVAAPGKNGGSTGAAPGCRILPVKVFHADDLASTSRVADAIRYAAMNADILSCSWSGATHPNIQAALEDAIRLGRGGKGVAIFCAAGNGSGRPVGFPASDSNTIAVGACTDQARRAHYSNVGPELAIVAPSSGGQRGIFTTDVALPNRGFNLGSAAAGGVDGLHTNSFGGTSSATPLTAGIAALMLSVNPNLAHTDIRDIITHTADRIGAGYDATGHSNEFGFGRVNAGKAVTEAAGVARTARVAGQAASGAVGPRTRKAPGRKSGAKRRAKGRKRARAANRK